MRWLRILLGGCPHPEMVRDRLTTDDGVERVAHYVCLDCGHAEPIVPRTADEHRQAQRAGAIRPPKAIKKPSSDPQTAALVRLRERKRA